MMGGSPVRVASGLSLSAHVKIQDCECRKDKQLQKLCEASAKLIAKFYGVVRL